MRDSPNGNSYRSDSPDSESPRDRTYQSKGSFIQKVREKERENRDYKSRDKYSGWFYNFVKFTIIVITIINLPVAQSDIPVG